MVLEKTLKSPLNSRRSNLSILKEINPGYSLEGLMLKLQLQYFAHLMQRADSWEKILMLERLRTEEAEDEMVEWHHQLNGHEFEQTPRDSEGQGILACYSPWGHRLRHNWSNLAHTHAHCAREETRLPTRLRAPSSPLGPGGFAQILTPAFRPTGAQFMAPPGPGSSCPLLVHTHTPSPPLF